MCEHGGNLRWLCAEECDHCFSKSFASHPKAQFWHPDRGWNELQPRNVFIRSGLKYWFTCDGCQHNFESILANVTKPRGQWCPYCCYPPNQLCSCEVCFEKSFASHPRAKFWHTTLNKLQPREVFLNCNSKFWFTCDNVKCRHDFEASLNRIARSKQGSWCPYCCEAIKKLCSSDKECDICFKKSFASHSRAQFWHQDKKWNKLTPHDIAMCSNKKFWFICDNENCKHTFKSSIVGITKAKCWCPYCSSPPKQLCVNINSCDICFNKSIVSHPKGKFWDEERNKRKPDHVFRGCDKKFWFTCDDENCGHKFQISPNSMTSANGWCPYCAKPPKRLCPNSLACNACFNKSFASNPKAQFWLTERNKSHPRDIFLNSHDKF